MSEFKIVIAHHPYEAQREDEISFEQEEIIKVTDFSDPDWWVGKKKDGSLGFFPSNFVTPKDENELEEPKEAIVEKPVTDDDQVTEEEQPEPVEEKKVDQVIGMARVMEDYAMQEAGELSLHRGGIINIYEVIDNEWSRGELNGKVGKYPSKYVEDIDMPGRPDLGKQSSDSQKSPVDDDAPKGGFKLAAFGVKQGGIGSLLAGGFPGLKKTSGAKPQQEKTEPVAAPAADPTVSTPAVPTEPPATPDVPAVPIVSKPTEEDAKKPATEAQKSHGKAIVLHPYDAESEDELSLLRGEYVEILDRNIDDGWWKGLNEKGQSGVFPCNFVRELEDEIVAPPTPTRARRTVQSRPASVQSPATARPISVQVPAQRPSSVSGAVAPKPASHLTSPSIIEEPKEEEDTLVQSPPVVEKVQSPPAVERVTSPFVEKIQSPPAVERVISPPVPERVQSPAIPERVTSPPVSERIQSPPVSERIQSPPVPERVQSPAVPECKSPLVSENSSVKSPVEERQESINLPERKVSLVSEDSIKSPAVVKEDPISDEEEKESGVEEIVSPVAVSREIKPVEETPKEVEPAVSKVEEPVVSEEPTVFEEPTVSEEPVVSKEPTVSEEPVVSKEPAVSEEAIITEEAIISKEPAVSEKKEDDKEEEKSAVVVEEDDYFKDTEENTPADVPEQVQEEKNEFDIIPSGPKLTTPSRVRIGGGRARRSPQATSQEPSQTEILQKELSEEKEEEKTTPSAPAKPVKPIFAKFPTPFAVGGDALSKTHLKPTQTRRLWEEKPAEPTTEEEEPAPVRPSGVKNIASRFNFAGGNTSGGNEVLETKLKNHTKNEVEKVKKEFEQLLNEERKKHTALEKMVNDLIEKVKALEQQ